MRAVRRFLRWLSTNHDTSYPQSVEQLLEHLSARHSEPCTKEVLKNAHEAMVFLEEASAVPAERRFTGLDLYSIGYKELLSKAPPGDTVKQAPRMFSTMMVGLEEKVMDPGTSVYSRIYAWWVLVQTWCTLRFSDHWGISPQKVKTDSSGLAKTIGADKSIVSRPLVLDKACWVSKSDWFMTGWRILQEAAGFERDYLLLNSNCKFPRMQEDRTNVVFRFSCSLPPSRRWRT